jgi:hypothetical protein
MKSRWILVSANLLVLVGLAFVYPAPMISPGPVGPAHAAVASACLACHAPFRGASPARCGKCHAIGDIGVRSTAGVTLEKHAEHPAFHQELTEQDCLACHTDHAGATLGPRGRQPFSHGLVRATTRDRCETCHTAPTSERHRGVGVGVGCISCHKTESWKPATMQHSTLAKTVLERCETCHTAPTAGSHPQVSGQCQQCHTTEGWKPASFEHASFFELDRNHAVACATCHTGNNYKRYTCYGCHEHTPDRIRAKHEEEGLRNLDNCVSCHKSPGGKHGEHGERGGRGDREKRGERRRKDD